MNYPGGKGGVFRHIINQIPPHDVYIEAFLGGGNVFERKRPARLSIGIDRDPAVIEMWLGHPGIDLVCADAVEYLLAYPWSGNEFVYCDPPYVMSTRKGGRIYRYEYDDGDHGILLGVLAGLPAPVMISGYPSALYDGALAGWRTLDFQAMTHGGPAHERLWMNYPEPTALHDLAYLGSNFRERERIKRKKQRWRDKLAKMPELERAAIMEAMLEVGQYRQE